MLKESFLANIKNLPEESIKIIVTRNKDSVLSPSSKLLDDYKKKRIIWIAFVFRFYKEMNNKICIKEMKKIKKLSIKSNVYLICYEKPPKNCHRHLLIDMINKLKI